jgi:hypothetical protein
MGFLDNVPRGTMIRLYLAQQLKCSPMRLTKRFQKETCIIGSFKYSPPLNIDKVAFEKRKAYREKLRVAFEKSLASAPRFYQNRQKRKKCHVLDTCTRKTCDADLAGLNMLSAMAEKCAVNDDSLKNIRCLPPWKGDSLEHSRSPKQAKIVDVEQYSNEPKIEETLSVGSALIPGVDCDDGLSMMDDRFFLKQTNNTPRNTEVISSSVGRKWTHMT